MGDANRGEFFRDVVAALEDAGNRVCVLRGYREYPENIGADIDLIADDPAEIPHTLTRRGVAEVVQIFDHETTFIHLCRWENGRPVFITLDVSKDHVYRGLVLLRGEEILANRRPFEFFHIPSPEMEFASYLTRRVLHASLSETQAERLGGLFREDPAGCARQVARFFPVEAVAMIPDAARSGDWEPVRARMNALRRSLLSRATSRQPAHALGYWPGVLRRRIGRFLRPPGLAVAFLGTDGAGKSTLMARVQEDLGPTFWSTKLYHKRPLSTPFRWTRRFGVRPPGAGKRGKDESSGFSPHAIPSRGAAYSLAKLGFWWADFTLLAYVADVLPQLTRPRLLLFDRYYHDLLVDPRRYHYGGSMRLARLAGKLIPRPDLVILLDAPPEVLRARKQELPLEEVRRQREAYLELVRGLPNGHVVDTSRPLDEAAEEAERVMLGHLVKRTARVSRL